MKNWNNHGIMILNFLYNHCELFVGLFIGLCFNFYFCYCHWKDQLIKDINKIIEDCRKLISFDAKSEDKMRSWLELGESELHRKSLFALRRIRKEMIRYFQIHLDMDIEKHGW